MTMKKKPSELETRLARLDAFRIEADVRLAALRQYCDDLQRRVTELECRLAAWGKESVVKYPVPIFIPTWPTEAPPPSPFGPIVTCHHPTGTGSASGVQTKGATT